MCIIVWAESTWASTYLDVNAQSIFYSQNRITTLRMYVPTSILPNYTYLRNLQCWRKGFTLRASAYKSWCFCWISVCASLAIDHFDESLLPDGTCVPFIHIGYSPTWPRTFSVAFSCIVRVDDVEKYLGSHVASVLNLLNETANKLAKKPYSRLSLIFGNLGERLNALVYMYSVR